MATAARQSAVGWPTGRTRHVRAAEQMEFLVLQDSGELDAERWLAEGGSISGEAVAR